MRRFFPAVLLSAATLFVIFILMFVYFKGHEPEKYCKDRGMDSMTGIFIPTLCVDIRTGQIYVPKYMPDPRLSKKDVVNQSN